MDVSFTQVEASTSKRSNTSSIRSSNSITATYNWEKLPDELTEKVFSHLSVLAISESRCVCKKWHRILSSPTFLKLWARSRKTIISHREEESWFLVYKNCHGVASFSPNSSKWRSIPLFARCCLDPKNVNLVASSGGLLCFRTRNTEQTNLVICNPVTNQTKTLPSMLQIRYIDIVGMVFHRSSNAYQILVTGAIESVAPYSITEVYDSATGCWDHHCSSEQEFLQFWCEVHAIWCNGSFYCLTMPISSTRGFRILVHDMVQRKWCDLGVEMPSKDLRCPSLLSCLGKLLLAGKIVVNRSMKNVCIWELDLCTRKWKEIASMPSLLIRSINVPHFLGMRCYSNSNLVCFSGHRSWQSVMYDLSRKTWQWMPENKVFRGSKTPNDVRDRNNLIGIAFEPDLVANV